MVYAVAPPPQQISFLHKQAPNRITTPTTATRQTTMAAMIPASRPTDPVAPRDAVQSTAAIDVEQDVTRLQYRIKQK